MMSHSISIKDPVRRHEDRTLENKASSFRFKEAFGFIVYAEALVMLVYRRRVLPDRISINSGCMTDPIILIFGLAYLIRVNAAIGILGALLMLAISALCSCLRQDSTNN